MRAARRGRSSGCGADRSHAAGWQCKSMIRRAARISGGVAERSGLQRESVGGMDKVLVLVLVVWQESGGGRA